MAHAIGEETSPPSGSEQVDQAHLEVKKSEYEKLELFSLPQEVLTRVFVSYLDVPDIVRLDTATSSTEGRLALNELLHGPRGICGPVFDRYHYTGSVGLEWALRREFPFNYMYLNIDQEDELDYGRRARDSNREHESDTESEGDLFSTTLHWASRRSGCAQVLTLLIKRGHREFVSPEEASSPIEQLGNNADFRSLALRRTCGRRRGRTAVDEALGIPGVDSWSVNEVDGFGFTPLLLACKYGCTKNIEVLLNLGKANVNCVDKNYYTPLSYLCEGNSATVIPMLLLMLHPSHQADINVQNNINGFTVLHHACSNGLLKVAQVLVRESLKGSIPCLPDLQSCTGNTALHLCCDTSSTAVAMTRLLLYEAKSNANILNDMGQTALHIACSNGRHDVARILLLEAAADPNIKDNRNRSVLMNACEDNDADLVFLLLSLGDMGGNVVECDLNAFDANGDRALHLSCSKGSNEVVALLIRSDKCNVNAKDVDGSTALYRMVESRNETMVKMLLQAGEVDVSICNREGLSPLECATKNKDSNIIALLTGTYTSNEENIEPKEEVWDVDSGLLRDASLGGSGGIEYKLEGSEKYLRIFTRSNDDSKNQNGFDFPPLFVDDIWPGALVLADHLQVANVHLEHVLNKRVIELGAGAALPGLVASCTGAEFVCITDYPAPGVIENIDSVLQCNGIDPQIGCAAEHIWGEPVSTLLKFGQENSTEKHYDTALMAECLWKDTVHLHKALMNSIHSLLRPGGSGFFAFAHRPSADGSHMPRDDLNIFNVAKNLGFSSVTRLPSICKYKDCMGFGTDENVEVHLYQITK